MYSHFFRKVLRLATRENAENKRVDLHGGRNVLRNSVFSPNQHTYFQRFRAFCRGRLSNLSCAKRSRSLPNAPDAVGKSCPTSAACVLQGAARCFLVGTDHGNGEQSCLRHPCQDPSFSISLFVVCTHYNAPPPLRPPSIEFRTTLPSIYAFSAFALKATYPLRTERKSEEVRRESGISVLKGRLCKS